jgi:hypothetical protein
MRVLVPPSAEILQKLRRNSEEILQNSFEEILWHPAEGAGDVLCTAELEEISSPLGFLWITGLNVSSKRARTAEQTHRT